MGVQVGCVQQRRRADERLQIWKDSARLGNDQKVHLARRKPGTGSAREKITATLPVQRGAAFKTVNLIGGQAAVGDQQLGELRLEPVLIERLGRNHDNVRVRQGEATHRGGDRHAIDSITALSPNIEEKPPSKQREIGPNSSVRLT